MDERPKEIVFTEREVSYFVVGLILGAFFIFVAGYFVGKRCMCEELSLQRDTQFADRVRKTFANLSDKEPEPGVSITNSSPASGEAAGESSKTGKQVACLCGFANKKLAEQYLEKLHRRGVSARIVERTSQASNGISSTWYQVITEPYDQKRLRALVKRLRRADRLSGIVITDA